MHHKTYVFQLLAAAACTALLTGCGGKAPTQAPTTPVSVPAGTPEAKPAPEAKPPTVDEWNDKALTAIKAQKWQAAIDAAKQAIALDANNSAGWFNLGRGQLGAGQAKEAARSFARASGLLEKTPNADVEFFLASALEASGNPVWALSVYDRALKRWPDDPDLPRAIADLKQQHDVTVLGPTDPVDVDGDGRPDQIEVIDRQVRITAADGKVLYETKDEEGNVPPQVYIYPLRGTTPLLRITSPVACMGGQLNDFRWYDRGAQAMIAGDGGGVCLAYQYLGDGRFEEIMAMGKDEKVVTVRWASGKWATEGTETRPRGK